jgi:hypothetical protein
VIPSHWPVHPRPLEAESLSSWLRRIAMIYGFTVKELLEHDLAFSRHARQRHWLDIDPSDKFVTAVAARTGVPEERVWRTTMAGVRPVLYALHDRTLPSYNTVLTARPRRPHHRHLQRRVLRQEQTYNFTACRLCLDSYPNAGVLLPWRLRVVTSCSAHGIMLEPVRIFEDTVRWLSDAAEEAPELVHSMDCRTWKALTSGYVDLPGGLVQAGVWFRLLRSIGDELNRPLEESREQQISVVWNGVDRFFQTAKNSWQLSSDRRYAIGVASAIDMMEKGTIVPEGIDGQYFVGKREETLTTALA